MEENETIMDKESQIIKVPVIDEMKKSFIAYAMAVNVSRAIPDVRDGLKPVHRRILYAMSELNLFNDKPYRKCARIVGNVLGNYHPHGDTAVYEALVRFAQDFTLKAPLVDGHGNFGSVDGDPPAAMRYTEARLSKIAGEMLRDIDKDSVDFGPNFDDTLMQPIVLPSRFPNLLVNGADGIAVGMATSIPTHNLGEVIDGVIALINNPDITVDELMDYIKAPDYPTGGIIMGRMGIRQAYKTGHGKVVVRGKCEIEEDEKGRFHIVITEIPHQVNKALLIQQMAGLVKDKRIDGISDIREESDREGMRIVVDIKKEANPQVVLNLLYKHSQLQTSAGITLLALVNGEPKILNLKEILYYYLEHQKQVILRRTMFDLQKAKEREHIVEGLVKALSSIDAVVKIIRQSKERQEALEKLMQSLEITEKQANAILDMRLVRLTSLEVYKLNEELEELQKFCAEMQSIIDNPNKVLAIIAKELTEIKEKYATPRQTAISGDVGSIDLEDLIAREDMVVTMTNQGYVKRMALSEYHLQHRGGIGVSSHKTKDTDFVDRVFVANTHDTLMFFTNYGKVYTLKTYEIPEASKSSKGRAVVNLIQIEQDERVQAVIAKSDIENGFLVLATKNGLIKKTPMSEFENIRQVGKKAIVLDEGDELISVAQSDGDDDILVASSAGKCIRFSEMGIRPSGRTSRGVRAMKLSDGAKLVDMCVVKEGSEMLTITENGFGKRVKVEDYRKQTRGGMGVSAGALNEKTGMVVALKQLVKGEDIIIIADNGVTIRVSSDSLRLLSRTAMGVKMMKLKGNSKIASVAVIDSVDENVDVEKVAEEVKKVEEEVEGVIVAKNAELANADLSAETGEQAEILSEQNENFAEDEQDVSGENVLSGTKNNFNEELEGERETEILDAEIEQQETKQADDDFNNDENI